MAANSDPNRAQWITILKAASANPPDEMNAEWEWLMGELELPLDYWLAVCAAIQQGRWREAKNPRGYIKTVASREARKMGLVVDELDQNLRLVELHRGRAGSIPRMEDKLEQINYAATTSDLLKGTDGVWRRGGSRDDDDRPELHSELEMGGFDSAWDWLLAKLPDELRLEKQPSAEQIKNYDQLNSIGDDYYHMRTASPNWKAWGQRAGFDEWEQQVLENRISRKSREKALAEQPNEASRKALQAAWKRFDRTGMERLQKALK